MFGYSVVVSLERAFRQTKRKAQIFNNNVEILFLKMLVSHTLKSNTGAASNEIVTI